jgi:GPH family glycoside/pentoside/hexuronide:cation symporter
MFGTSIPINMFKAYAAIFYVDTLGLRTTQYSLILAIYSFVDAIDNPVYGFLSDRTRSRWGRRRPWLVIGVPLLVLFFVLFYNPPALSEGSLFWYMLVTYILTGTLDSLINANYGALFPELFKGDAARAKTNALRQAFQFVAMIISLALTPVVAGAIGYKWTSIAYGALAAVVILYMTFGCHEDPAAQEKPQPRLLSTIREIVTNPKFWLYGVTNALFFAAQSVLLQAVPFYTKYALGEGSVGTMIMQGTALLVVIGTIFIWTKLIKRLTLMRAWRLSFLIIAVGLVPLYFSGTLALSAALVVVFGFGLAGSSVTMDLVGARLLDEDAARHGIQREGLYGSLVGMLNKMNGLLAALAFYLVSVFFGYQSGDSPGPNPGAAAKFLIIIFPCALMVLCFGFSFLLNFKEKVKE